MMPDICTIDGTGVTPSFDQLPEEIIIKIFSYLPQWHLQYFIKNVCQLWNRLSSDKSLYRNVSLDSHISSEKARIIIRQYFDIVERLNISERSDTNQILNFISLCPNLRSLNLNSCNGSSFSSLCNRFIYGLMPAELNADSISSILESNGQLSQLSVLNSRIQKGGIRLVNCKLESLIVRNSYHYCRAINENATGTICRNKMKVLDLRGLIIDDKFLLRLIFNNQSTLQTIKLDVWLPNNSMNQVIEQIQWCTNLKTLLLINSSHNLVEDGNFRRLTELKHLTTIVLYHMEKITFTSMASLFKQAHSKFLSKIVLTSCDGVNADVVKTIADNCVDLKVFGLHQFRCIEADIIKANDVLYLASKCSKLEKLDLRYTHRSVGFSLAKVIECLTRLKCFKYCDRCRKNIMMPILSILKKNVKGFKIDVRVWLNSDNYICGITNCY